MVNFNKLLDSLFNFHQTPNIDRLLVLVGYSNEPMLYEGFRWGRKRPNVFMFHPKKGLGSMESR